MIADAQQPTVKGSPRSYHDAVSCYEAINPFSFAETRNEKEDPLPLTLLTVERTGRFMLRKKIPGHARHPR